MEQGQGILNYLLCARHMYINSFNSQIHWGLFVQDLAVELELKPGWLTFKVFVLESLSDSQSEQSWAFTEGAIGKQKNWAYSSFELTFFFFFF